MIPRSSSFLHMRIRLLLGLFISQGKYFTLKPR